MPESFMATRSMVARVLLLGLMSVGVPDVADARTVVLRTDGKQPALWQGSRLWHARDDLTFKVVAIWPNSTPFVRHQERFCCAVGYSAQVFVRVSMPRRGYGRARIRLVSLTGQPARVRVRITR
jgi:hypothetical protein